ncbi:kinase-like domain-containing protein [Rhizophagus irregularis DAOM 181602=DAOM 197198]|nr:kinase-like domain-containing protein [Rhizophagus irregularis DAOM 181602=DAOM 197198]
MSNNAELVNNSNDLNKWIEEAISKKLIKYYEFDLFYDIQEIGFGGFGKVSRANWKNSHKRYAIKSFFNINDATVKAIIREIQLQREVDFHDNVIRFYGVTISRETQKKVYSLVIEYAENGTLRKYLKENFENLTWEDKLDLAFQLAYAVLCLHDEGIMHRDLHSNNVGRPPFGDELNDLGLAMAIFQGLREKPIPDTPEEYIKIYTDCWNIEPDNRPTINQVVNELKAKMTKENIIIKDLHLHDNNKNIQSSNNQQPIKISENIDSLHGDLSKLIQDFNMMNTKKIESSISLSNQFENSFDMIVNDMINLLDYDSIEEGKQKLLTCLNSHNITLQEYNNLLLNNQNSSNSLVLLGQLNFLGVGMRIETDIDKKKAFELFQKAVDLENSYGMIGLGHCYQNGIGTDIDKKKAFELFQKATGLENSSGIDHLGYCYENGIGTDINENKAFELYQKAADLENLDGMSSLGQCYQYGIGTDIDKKKAFELYQKAADLGNSYGINSLGYCYQHGIGTDVDKKKALELYQKAADLENAIGIFNLGYCYQNGIGTDIDKKKAFELFQKAVDLGNVDGMNSLGYFYQNGIGIDINIKKAFEFYQRSADLENSTAQYNLAMI